MQFPSVKMVIWVTGFLAFPEEYIRFLLSA
ncbi:hypothetical protein V525_08515 [Gordonia alkanivorans CGMCC 6845]|uniref:Uncharacterized protein n=1 Tax=Gordonia alkanivorans CGMCC 6845 TaxID=1423140 RepID=W9DDI4_9ACTN|nr:hypothetical protein V525_08515 [Gordonia alkanivorans CGMCC 6845]